jgi:hypothetical protein
MSYTADDQPGMSLSSSSDLFTDLSENEQESVSGGLFFYYNQTQINSGADFANSFSGTLGDNSGNSSLGTGANGTFTGSGSSNYQLNSTTFILSGSDQMMFYMLPSILQFMTNFGI